ncbi:MAG: hypothetical protein AAGF84_00705 [Planctomycetota bacterium]
MLRLQTVLLRHARRGDTHYDWMFETPGPGARTAPLTTFRVATAWRDWPRRGRIALTPLPPHRRVYLTKQGPVSGDRGFVTRIAHGTLDVLDWHGAGGTLLLRDQYGQPPIQLTLGNVNEKTASLCAIELGSAAASR